MKFPYPNVPEQVAVYMLRTNAIVELHDVARRLRAAAETFQEFPVRHALECEARGIEYALELVTSCLDRHAPVKADEVDDAG